MRMGRNGANFTGGVVRPIEEFELNLAEKVNEAVKITFLSIAYAVAYFHRSPSSSIYPRCDGLMKY